MTIEVKQSGVKAILSSNKGVELKGGMYTFMSLKLHTTDIDIIDVQLADKVQQAPGFFKDTPVVVDFTAIEEFADRIDSKALLECIRSHALQPIVASLSNKTSPLANAIALPLVESGMRRSTTEDAPDLMRHGESSPVAESESADAPAVELTSMASREVEYVVKTPTLIDRPVRSGQQVYARDTDLIVMGQVGPGAEVIADNNIHIYGPLRGRALCGVSGNTGTRIFCQSLEAELVSVAGNYRMLETISEELRGRPAQIWLENDRLNIEPL